MKRVNIRPLLAALVIIGLTISTMADQRPPLSRVMREKLTHAQAILGAVVTSDWGTLDRESQALFKATRDPAWIVLTDPEYMRYSDDFIDSVHQLIVASSRKDLDAAADAQIALTTSCVQCHRYLARHRMTNATQP